jgi:hypothetical protein
VQSLRASGGSRPGQLDGAVVTFRRVEGLTARHLQRALDCQVARNVALRYSAADTRWCPLAVRGVRARAELTERGMEVRLEADDADEVTETYARAVALLGARGK